LLTALRPIDSEERSVPRPRSGDTASLPDKAIDLTDQAGARVRRRAAPARSRWASRRGR